MKNFENFRLSNRGKIFLIIIISIALFFIFAGLSKLVAQDFKDPLGYELKFKKDNRVYILYNSNGDYSLQMDHNEVVVDSFYFQWVAPPERELLSNSETEKIYPSIFEKILSRVYFCSEGKEMQVYSKVKKRRSQEHWPTWEWITLDVYGKRLKRYIKK